MLDINKDDYRASEMKKLTICKIALAVQLGYDTCKIILPFTTYY